MHGASPLRVLRRITVRLAWPGILAASIYIFMTAFAAFDVPAIIGWGNRIFTFTTYLYLLLNPQDALPEYGLAAALSTVAMAIAAGMSVWYGAMQQRSRRFAVVTGRAYRPKITKLGARAIGAWAFIGSYLALAKVLPIALLLWSSLLPFFQLPSQLRDDLTDALFLAALGTRLHDICQHGAARRDHADRHARNQSRLLMDRAALQNSRPPWLRFHRLPAARHPVDRVRGRGASAHAVRAPARAPDLRHDLDPARRLHDRTDQLRHADDQQRLDPDPRRA
jgi:hypothetical protein